MSILGKPDSDYCYEIRVFGNGESRQCPDLDDRIVRKPKCTKYDVDLSWNVSGRITKCRACLDNK